ncbi:MAG: Segregation and condensation protein B [Chlamydiales bacterium]|nr:Segregation and condensation protein B [Chlamydiales bacterium]
MNQELNLIEQAIETVAERSYNTLDREIKQIVEALLFSSSEAIPLQKIKDIVQTAYPIRTRELKELIEALAQEYKEEQRAFQIDEIAGGYLLRTNSTMRPFIEKLLSDRRGEKLSVAATEILAVIAYRSPITRREIEKIRGVDCSGTVAALVERGLIQAIGRKEAPGRPMQFGITKLFLQHFGLKDLQDLSNLVTT